MNSFIKNESWLNAVFLKTISEISLYTFLLIFDVLTVGKRKWVLQAPIVQAPACQ